MNNSVDNSSSSSSGSSSRPAFTRSSGSNKNFSGSGYKRKPFFFKKKVCFICQKNLELEINYKNITLLRRFVSERGKILPRRLTGTCVRHQRMITRAIKQARIVSLLWFVPSN